MITIDTDIFTTLTKTFLWDFRWNCIMWNDPLLDYEDADEDDFIDDDDEPWDDDLEFGFNPYEGCYDFNC